MRARELIFGAVAVLLLALYAVVGARLYPALSQSGAGLPAPPAKPAQRVPAQASVPGTIAFTLRGDVFVLRGDGYAAQTSEGRSLSPGLSADGSVLVFTRSEEIDGKRVVDGQVANARLGFANVIRKPPAGGDEEILVSGLRRVNGGFHRVSWFNGPALSPDGKRLAVVEDDGDGAADLEVVDVSRPAGQRTAAVLSRGANLADPAWSPDGKTIAVSRYNGEDVTILLWPADGRGAPQRPRGLPEGDAYRPSFSPDGRWLVYTLRTNGGNDVHALELPTQRDVALTADGRSWNGVFSFDGRWIAFLRVDHLVIDLWAMELGDALSGGAARPARKLTRGEGVDGASRPSWSR